MSWSWAHQELIQEVKDTLASWEGKGMAATKELRAFLGRLSWIAGNCPKTEVDGDSHVRGSHQRAAGRQDRTRRGTRQNRRGDTRSTTQSMDFLRSSVAWAQLCLG